MFELVEWAIAAVVADDLAAMYLGTQGDVWDAHKDTALASCGALIAMSFTALINWRLHRDFAREWAASLRVKHPRPLGEEVVKRRRRR
jgi:putative membrane protein